MILAIRSNELLEFNVFETYLRLIAWHHLYFNAQSCRILSIHRRFALIFG